MSIARCGTAGLGSPAAARRVRSPFAGLTQRREIDLCRVQSAGCPR